jgi:predicted nucleic acid-binding protein
MRGLYVDTGFWLALLDAADPLHPKAKSIVETYKTYPLFSSDHVLSETVTLLRRELGPEPAGDLLPHAPESGDFPRAVDGEELSTLSIDDVGAVP